MWLQVIGATLKSDIISFLEFVYAAACINKLLFTGEERMALIADIHFKRVDVFSRTRLKCSSASAYNRNFVIIGMYFGLHIITSLCYSHYYSNLLYTNAPFKSINFTIFEKNLLPANIVAKRLK